MNVSFLNGTLGRFLGQYLGHFSGQNNHIELPPRSGGHQTSNYVSLHSAGEEDTHYREGEGGGEGPLILQYRVNHQVAYNLLLPSIYMILPTGPLDWKQAEGAGPVLCMGAELRNHVNKR